MRKRVVEVLIGFILILLLVGCNSTNIITLQNGEIKIEEIKEGENVEIEMTNISVYRTEKTKEYIAFLESFDESNYEILGISTCMETGIYTNSSFYMVTYKKLYEPREVKRKGKVSLFTTKSQKAYDRFLTDLDERYYEILGISTSMSTGIYTNGEFYMVTFRELN